MYIIKWLYFPYRSVFIFATILHYTAQYFWVRLVAGPDKYPAAKYYTQMFEMLGGSFIKAGQALSVRYDILSPETCEALSSLQDDVKQFPTAEGIAIIEKELKKTLAELFYHFEPEPIAAASLSQVYKAYDHDRNVLAIKVQRPNIRLIILTDTLFLNIVRYFCILFTIGSRIGLPQVIKEVVDSLRSELNYKMEAQYIELFGLMAEKIPYFKVPSVYRKLSTDSILTMEFIEGISIKELISFSNNNGNAKLTHSREELEKVNLNHVSNKIYEITLRCIFESGIFHADPHPGNIIVMDDGMIGYIDYGIIGTLDKKQRNYNLQYLSFISKDKTEDAADIFSRILEPTRFADRDALIRQSRLELEYYLNRVKSSAYQGKEKTAAPLYINSIKLARHFGYKFPQNVLLFYKALFTTDNVLITLDPNFDSKNETVRIISEIKRMEITTEHSLGAILERWTEGYQSILKLPETMIQIEGLVEKFSAPKSYSKDSIGYQIGKLSGFVGQLFIGTSLFLTIIMFVAPDKLHLFDNYPPIASIGFIILLFLVGLNLKR